ncbi:VWA domain-containing protein [Chloroflexota bacterium]
MKSYRYSEWDGSQDIFDLNPDKLMDELEKHIMSYGDLDYALRLMQRQGLRDEQGRRLPSLQELLQRLRRQKQEQLDKYNLDSVMDDIREKLEEILNTEREGIQEKLDDARRKAEETTGELDPEVLQRLLKNVEDRAAQNIEKLDALPPDIGGQIRELTDYDFMDEDARNQFKELMDMLRKQAMESYGRDMVQQMKNMDPAALAGMRHMIEALNQMLEQRMRGEEPDFEKFMEEFGDYFGPDPPKNLDELMQRMQDQIAQAQSLLDSLSPEDRKELQDLMQSMLDDSTQMELAKLSNNLDRLLPRSRQQRQYPFTGEEALSYNEALKLMEQLQQMDKLETQLRDSQFNRSLDNINEDLLKQLLGDEAAEDLERLRDITKVLEDAGYIRMNNGRYELTPRGMRKIGQKALEDIFAQLKKDRIGGHNLNLKGYGGERIPETKQYEYGDDFQVHLQKSIMNAINRQPGKPPVKMTIEDFEVFKQEELTRTSTVLLLDMSLSMPMRGNFEAAKRVTLALDGLIRSQYPKDSLHIVGFSSYAREIKKKDVTLMNWDDFDPYTNMQHGLQMARKLLDRDRTANKQIILISDGEPTAHFENGRLFFQYPPTMRTMQLTLREVRRCTQKGITINTFMLDTGRFVGAFVTQMAKMNKGRVFYTSADNLGEYLLVDYLSNKKKRL